MEDEREIDERENNLYWTKKEPRKSFATFQSNQNRLLSNSINQIDRKAAILIKINTTIVSATIVFFKNVSEISSGRLIGSVLVICLFVSLFLAILAVKPPMSILMKIYKTKIKPKYPNIAENIFLIGGDPSVSFEDYEKGYDEILKSVELQIGNPIRAMYIFEHKIHYSFRMIEWSYNAFIFGFLFSVIVFLISNFTNLI